MERARLCGLWAVVEIYQAYICACPNILYKKERTSAMYKITNTYPKLTEAEIAELKLAAARAVHSTLTQYLKENEE